MIVSQRKRKTEDLLDRGLVNQVTFIRVFLQVTWLETDLFTVGLGFLMLSMGLTLTFEDFRRCLRNPWTVRQHPFLLSCRTLIRYMYMFMLFHIFFFLLQVGVGFLAQYLIKPMLGFVIAMVITTCIPCYDGMFERNIKLKWQTNITTNLCIFRLSNCLHHLQLVLFWSHAALGDRHQTLLLIYLKEMLHFPFSWQRKTCLDHKKLLFSIWADSCKHFFTLWYSTSSLISLCAWLFLPRFKMLISIETLKSQFYRKVNGNIDKMSILMDISGKEYTNKNL